MRRVLAAIHPRLAVEHDDPLGLGQPSADLGGLAPEHENAAPGGREHSRALRN